MRQPNVVVLKEVNAIEHGMRVSIEYDFWATHVREGYDYMDVFYALFYDPEKEYDGVLITWQDIDEMYSNGIDFETVYMQGWL